MIDPAYVQRMARYNRWRNQNLFNHQTHHRGQAHCMLTRAGGKPSITDLPAMPE